MRPTCHRLPSVIGPNCGAQTCPWRSWPPRRGPFLMSCCVESASGCHSNWSSTRGPNAGSAFEESHLYAGQLNHIIVGETAGLGANGLAIDQRKIILGRAVDVHDEVATRAVRDRGDLNARATQCRQ